MRVPELLIPASSLEVLKTAVIFGADAVYIGGEAFGLRAKAKNFSMEDMKQKPLLNRLVESHVFERYIVLDAKPHAGSVQAIFDGRGTTLYRREAFL